MTLNFIVAKNRHADLLDASKLEPIIKNADVVSIESAALTVKGAIEMELDQREYVLLARTQRRAVLKSMSRNITTYNGLLNFILSKYAKPVVFLERHEEKDAKKVEELQAQIEQIDNYRVSLVGLLKKKYEEAMRIIYINSLKEAEIMKIRDTNMIQNGF